MFAASVILLFVALGLWQLDRHNERAARNELVVQRSGAPATAIDEVQDLSANELDYRYVEATGTYLAGDFVRVVNRSRGGAAGEHVVAVLRLDDGRDLLVNRGFVPTGTPRPGEPADGARLPDPVPEGQVVVRGWLRVSAEQGWLGATDSGEGVVVPRLDVDAVAVRLGDAQAAAGVGPGAGVVPVWLLLEGPEPGSEPASTSATDTDTNTDVSGALSAMGALPDPVPLPPVDGGPHLSYMGQWFIFAVLGAGFYGALLRRNARGGGRSVAIAPPKDSDW